MQTTTAIRTTWAIILLSFFVLYGLTGLFRPLLPVDETRYLTVAWEMWQRHDFLVPYLNGLPYSHKPPLLFWLIHLTWFWGGVSLTAARLVPLFFGLGTIYLTTRIATLLWPEKIDIKQAVMIVMSGSILFMIASTLMMFDVLLTFWVVLAQYFLLQTLLTQRHRYWVGYGFALGFALLAKGPVAFVHLGVVPLLAYWWYPQSCDWRKWYRYFLFANLLGIAIIALWALPAAYHGGALYKQAILWQQTAGRMVHSFSHAKPFWFYLVLLPAILFPWILWPSFWKRLSRITTLFQQEWTCRYLILWFMSVFLIFSVISGKQIHYLMPLLPPFALFFSFLLTQYKQNITRANLGILIMLVALVTVGLFFHPLLMTWFQTRQQHIPPWLYFISLIPLRDALLIVFVALGVMAWYWRKQLFKQMMGSFMGVFIIVTAQMVFQPVFKPFDLHDVVAWIHAQQPRQIAYDHQYRGEIGFLARLTKPVEVIRREEINPWLRAHPQGLLVVERLDRLPATVNGKLIYQMPYRNHQLGLLAATPARFPLATLAK